MWFLREIKKRKTNRGIFSDRGQMISIYSYLQVWIDVCYFLNREFSHLTLNTLQHIYWITVKCFEIFLPALPESIFDWVYPLVFSSLATMRTQHKQAYGKRTVNPLLAPRQSVTEFISQSNTVFPPAEVSCHSCFVQPSTPGLMTHPKREH